MTGIAATQDSAADRFGKRFWQIVLVGSVVFLLAGGVGFGYLRLHSPLALLGGSDRPVAAASAFVPVQSPFTISLLTEPDRLVSLSQAIVRPDQRALVRGEIEQAQQNLQQITGLSYELDVQPWLGQEITFAYTATDLDRNLENGQQPGYLLIFEIAPGRYEQAQSFLQLFWQRQAIAGNAPIYQTVSGVKVLASQDTQAASLSAASALAGRQFVMFANDVSVLRNSIRAAQTAQNLAQSPLYRRQVAALPDQRIALAYLDARLLKVAEPAESVKPLGQGPVQGLAKGQTDPQFIAVSLEAKRDGLMAIAQLPEPTALPGAQPKASKAQIVSLDPQADSLWDLALADYLPADSELAVIGHNINELSAAWAIAKLPDNLLPKFMSLQPPTANSFADALFDPSTEGFGKGYALSQVSFGPSPDWVLAVPRETAQIAELDQAAIAAGYSVVPVAMETADEATAWTRFAAKGGKRAAATALASRRSGLESELLGLHLQQGRVEIFASSLAAMDSALESQAAESQAAESQAAESKRVEGQTVEGRAKIQIGAERALASSQFVRATAPLIAANSDTSIYLNWPRVAPTVERLFPMLNRVQAVASPLTNHIGKIAASHEQEKIRIFIQLAD